MSTPLRGDEVLSCRHRVCLNRGAPGDITRVRASDEAQYRRQLAEKFRDDVQRAMLDAPGSFRATSLDDTRTALEQGIEIVIAPRLGDDIAGHRRARVHALIRLGRRDEHFFYAPVLIKNSEVVEDSSSRQLLVTDVEHLAPAHAHVCAGVAVRPTRTLTRSGIALAHATRVMQSLGCGDELGRVALIDRQRRVWWLELASAQHFRFNLASYDLLYHERRELLDAHDDWLSGAASYPTSPYWHRECEECVFNIHCRTELEAKDDVSLTHYTNFEQQRLLHEFSIHTRRDLAALDPRAARLARRSAIDSPSREAVLGVAVERLDDLIYRARAHVNQAPLRRVEPEKIGCPRADVEVDVDMESYAEHTYLWGATVRLAAPVDGVEEGYYSFVDWNEPTQVREAKIFAQFWEWLSALRDRCAAHGLTFGAYCFWAQAEDGAMNRAVDPPCESGPTREDLERFRTTMPSQWIDLHHCAKSQIQTEGPLGLKVLARIAGFEWRDENPSGEASMRWFEAATSGSDVETWRERILQYNEDDCRATQSLRDWLNGPARALAHRDQLDITKYPS